MTIYDLRRIAIKEKDENYYFYIDFLCVYDFESINRLQRLWVYVYMLNIPMFHRVYL